jgi:hypothetical protein
MSRLSLKALQAAAGAAAGGAVYVDDVFSTYLYTGNGSAQTITNGIDLDGEGGLVWTKARVSTSGGNTSHALIDTERGSNKWLSTNSSSVEATNANLITSFNSDGYSVGTGGPYWTNDNGYDYVSWTFRKQPGFFDVLTFTGDGTTGRQISHSLGSTPGMVVVKKAGPSVPGASWMTWHRGASLGVLRLDQTGGTSALGAPQNIFGDNTNVVAPTSTHFTVGNSADVNASGNTYIAYLFAHDAQDFGTDSDESIIKCGSYTGNGSTTGPVIDLGFEPQWVMIKNISFANDWWVFDSMRGITSGGADSSLRANLSSAENTGTNALKVTATGFQLENSGGDYNGSTQQYIYVAIRRPHKPAEEFAATDLYTAAYGVTSPTRYQSGFPVDMATHWDPQYSGQRRFHSRLTGATFLRSDATNVETASSGAVWDSNTSWADANLAATSTMSYMFRRAPGFFDVVAYTGTGSTRTVSHNLGVAPEMIIVKCRGNTNGWCVYHESIGVYYTLFLQQNGVPLYNDTLFNTAPTGSVFTVGSGSGTNQSGQNIISYHFATVPGISKVGSYSGTGSDVDVACGFSAGARFVLVKRTDAGGDWYVWDSARGIVAGNDPYVLLNSNAAQVTSTDYIDPLSSGFTVTSSAPAALNASGGNYIFLAIA